MVVVGVARESGERMCIANIYAPCNDTDQLLQWDRLKLVVEQWADVQVCLIGDFNAILEPWGESRGGEWRDVKRKSRAKGICC